MSRAHESAYPITDPSAPDNYYGLTIREHFAGLAMQGLLACSATDGHTAEHLAMASVRNADALIAELEKARG